MVQEDDNLNRHRDSISAVGSRLPQLEQVCMAYEAERRESELCKEAARMCEHAENRPPGLVL